MRVVRVQEQKLLHPTLILSCFVGQDAAPLSCEDVPYADAATIVTSGQHVWRHIRHALHIFSAQKKLPAVMVCVSWSTLCAQ